MPAPIEVGYLLPQADYAYIYAVDLATVSDWQQRSLPLDVPERLWPILLPLLARDQSCPASTRAKGLTAIQADYDRLAQR